MYNPTWDCIHIPWAMAPHSKGQHQLSSACHGWQDKVTALHVILGHSPACDSWAQPCTLFLGTALHVILGFDRPHVAQGTAGLGASAREVVALSWGLHQCALDPAL